MESFNSGFWKFETEGQKLFLSTVNHLTAHAVTVMLPPINFSRGEDSLGFPAFSLAASSCFYALCGLQYEQTQWFTMGVVKHAF